MDEHDEDPPVVGTFDMTYGMSPEEWGAADQGRFLCVDCGEFYASDGTDQHDG